MTHSFLRFTVATGMATWFSFFTHAPSSAAEQVAVADELERLSEVHGFNVRGLDQTLDAFGRAEGQDLFPRLRRLLENFDHVIVQSPEGGVDRVIVIGEKVPFQPALPTVPAEESVPAVESGHIVVQTERRGTQHVVQVSLEGKGGAKLQRELHVDTGADYLVLPLSLVSQLGVDRKGLAKQEMQTANGKVGAYVGSLPALWFGENRVVGIETAFIEDDKLGGSGLLGMSVLKRYKLTIDDETNRITLSGKEGGDTPVEKQAVLEDREGEAGSEDPGDRNP